MSFVNITILWTCLASFLPIFLSILVVEQLPYSGIFYKRPNWNWRSRRGRTTTKFLLWIRTLTRRRSRRRTGSALWFTTLTDMRGRQKWRKKTMSRSSRRWGIKTVPWSIIHTLPLGGWGLCNIERWEEAPHVRQWTRYGGRWRRWRLPRRWPQQHFPGLLRRWSGWHGRDGGTPWHGWAPLPHGRSTWRQPELLLPVRIRSWKSTFSILRRLLFARSFTNFARTALATNSVILIGSISRLCVSLEMINKPILYLPREVFPFKYLAWWPLLLHLGRFLSMLTSNHCCADSSLVLIVELKGLWVLTFDHHDDHYLGQWFAQPKKIVLTITFLSVFTSDTLWNCQKKSGLPLINCFLHLGIGKKTSELQNKNLSGTI